MAPSQKALLVLVLSMLLTASDSRARRIDCTRFVYAPICRGVAAKRGGDSLSVGASTELDDALTDPFLRSEEPREEDTEKKWRELSRLSRVLQILLSHPTGETEQLDRLLTL
uniref:Elevenin n=1 Tax=Conus ebraeus TaxID=89425 RepID=CELE_CONEA|nr:RecName: Full=Elevenin; Flags: Precursor [Conus ebraeus]UMA82996.1 venom-related protein elevenin [Conus ebraeus]